MSRTRRALIALFAALSLAASGVVVSACRCRAVDAAHVVLLRPHRCAERLTSTVSAAWPAVFAAGGVEPMARTAPHPPPLCACSG